jgi:hypothetical protein
MFRLLRVLILIASLNCSKLIFVSLYLQWLKQERFYEMWESRMAMRRRGRKKVPIQNRLN